MSGTREGARKSRDKILAKDPEFFSRIGKVGGAKKAPTKGFASTDPRLHQLASAKGGKVKRRV